MNATQTRITVLPMRRAQSRSPAPIAWPTNVVPADAMPMAGRYASDVIMITS